ncbi:MAG: sensor histidine kinase [Clostridiales bacterium]|nr:sensor histidine kinase [Clostridiales bacterium]
MSKEPNSRKRFSWNLLSKLICLLLCMTVIPLAVFGTLLFAIQQKISTSYVKRSMEVSVQQAAASLSRELSNIQSLASLFYLDSELISALEQDEVDAEQLLSMSTKYTAALNQLNVKVYFLDRNGVCYGQSSALPDALTEEISAQIDPISSNIRWFASGDLEYADSSRPFFYIARPMHDEEHRLIGLLILSLPESELWKLCSGLTGDEQNAYILDRSGHLLLTVDNQALDYVPDSEDCALYSGTFLESDPDEPQLVSYYTVNVSASTWTLVFSSSWHALMAPYLHSNLLFCSLLLIYFIAAVFLSLALSRRFVAPIRQLQSNIQLAKAGDLDTLVPVASSDEIGQLSEQYNELLREIKLLIAQQMKDQQARHEAEMQALQAQINPHFIYNTLASIRFLIFAKQNEKADRAMIKLIDILRGMFSNPHYLSTVGRELKLLEDYIYLQEISFSQSLQVTFDVDDDVRNCPLCKLTLQPIVENSFIHGFAPSQKLCILEIAARAEEDCVHITLRDNGVGFVPVDGFPPKNPPREWSRQNGLGLGNVRKRIRQAFGKPYDLYFESEPDQGTTAHLIIPKTPGKGDVLTYDSSDRR